MQVAEKMRQKLTAHLDPVKLEIKDDSHKHEGHAGHDGQGESHFRILIVSDVFEEKNRVERQRLIYDILQEELREKVHALSLKTLTPQEEKSL